MGQSSKVHKRVSQLLTNIHSRHSFWRQVTTLLAWLWHVIWWIWSTVIIGGLIVGILVSYATKGISDLADPRTWIVIHPLIAHPLQTAVVITFASILTLLAYLAHRRQHRALKEDQLHHNEALLDIARGVRRAVEELNTRPSFGTPLSPNTSKENLETILTLTPIWNVPYHRNPFFTGREHILKRLHDMFTAGEPTSPRQPQAICGLGGIGKTQTAVEYAYRYRDDYRAVLWARADSRETLVSDFVAIANLLKLPQKDAKDQNLAVSAVKSWLETNMDWLLILDEVEDLNMASHFLSTGSKGHMLLTSRAQATGTIAQSVELEKMEPEEGALFLLRRAKIIRGNVSLDTVSAADHTIARDIVQAMDRLPLALDQAGAYIEETACKLSDYLHIYQTQHADLLKVRLGYSSQNKQVKSFVENPARYVDK